MTMFSARLLLFSLILLVYVSACTEYHLQATKQYIQGDRHQISGSSRGNNHISGTREYDYMIFSSAYLGDYGISRVMQNAVDRLSLDYKGALVRSRSLDIERSLLYDMLSRNRVDMMFFLPENIFTLLGLVSRYPQQKFVMPFRFDSERVNLPPNLKMAKVRLEQGAFIAGIIAGKMTRNNRVGMLTDVSGQGVEALMFAFVQGVEQVNKQSEIVVVRTDKDENMLQNETTRMVSVDNVDVMFALSVNYNDTVIHSTYYLGSDVLIINGWYDADADWPKHVVVSLVLSAEPIIQNFMTQAEQLEDFSDLPPIQTYDLSDKDVMRFSWDEKADTAFEVVRPEYSELSHKTRKEAKEWVKRIRTKEFVVYNSLENGMLPLKLDNLQFRDSCNYLEMTR